MDREEPGGLQSMGSQRVGRTEQLTLSLFTQCPRVLTELKMLQDGLLGKESPRQGLREVKRALERNTCGRMEKDAGWGGEKKSHMQTNTSPDHLHKGTELGWPSSTSPNWTIPIIHWVCPPQEGDDLG